MKTTEENNKLIAEFMGLPTEEKGLTQVFLDKQRKYDTSWDWLMPVVEKIGNELGSLANFKIEGTRVILKWFLGGYHNDIYVDSFGDAKPLEIHENENTMIESIYKAVIEFINWYNENK